LGLKNKKFIRELSHHEKKGGYEVEIKLFKELGFIELLTKTFYRLTNRNV